MSASPMLQSGARQNLAQAWRLKGVFASAGLRPRGRHDAAMQGVMDGNKAAVRQAPHFYLATYGILRSYAGLAGSRTAAALLGKMLGGAKAAKSRAG